MSNISPPPWPPPYYELLLSISEHSKVYEEAGSDFHQVAYFKTRIGLRNALREEISGSSDREAVLITLNRPIVFAQPVAFDRGMEETIAAKFLFVQSKLFYFYFWWVVLQTGSLVQHSVYFMPNQNVWWNLLAEIFIGDLLLANRLKIPHVKNWIWWDD